MYGLTERNYDAMRSARFMTNPGCYPTAALLALEPLAEAGLLGGEIVIDAKSGISGAGKKPSDRTHFSENHGSVSAYGVFGHRHQPEIEQELGAPVTFVPHLVPLDRGILETIYAKVQPGTTSAQVGELMSAAYQDAPFVRVTGETLPEIKHVAYTNFCDIGWRVDAAGGRILLVAVIDNLVKGAAGQAIQNMNVMLGFDERTGLLPLSHENPVVVKFGGELLEDPERVAALAATIGEAQPHDAARHRPRRRPGDRRGARAGGHRETSGRRPAHYRRADARGRRQRAGRAGEYAARGGAWAPPVFRAVGLTGADAGIGRVKAAPPHRRDQRRHGRPRASRRAGGQGETGASRRSVPARATCR